jgi:hypothetical protein
MVKLKESSFNMFCNFYEFIDLINIQNDNFTKKICTFEPQSLITSVISLVTESCDCKSSFFPDQLPKTISGDKDRLKYILVVLLKNSLQRNNQFDDLDPIQITAQVTDSQTLDFDDFNDSTLIVRITD